MEIKKAFGQAFRLVRKFKGLTLLGFSTVSGRNYIGAIERGVKSPTIEKMNELGEFLDIHPITISYLAYLNANENESFDSISKRVKSELIKIQNFKHH
ncbi:MAG: helix-turn-helix domain-containing protein [Candidatus Paceibacterota bacterium]